MLQVVPVSLDEANEFITRFHRHHEAVVGHKFSIGVASGDEIVGVAIVGRTVARMAHNRWTLEVNRTCTDGTRNANSMLYGAAWRAARALGYRKMITYTLPGESGASLRAAGWRCMGPAGGGSWSRDNRPRVDKAPTETKLRWEITDGMERDQGREVSDVHIPERYGDDRKSDAAVCASLW